MNDKNDLLLTEAMDLISRAKSMIDLLRAEEQRSREWTCPLETARRQLADAHEQLDALGVSARATCPEATSGARTRIPA